VNVTKLEGLFADEVALIQPTTGYMRLLKESVVQIREARKARVREKIAESAISVRQTRKNPRQSGQSLEKRMELCYNY